jgi:cytidylate kinase
MGEGVAVLRRSLIVTIDGPAGVGKSTAAKRLAEQLEYAYLDTGALYRAVAWKVEGAAIDPSNVGEIEALLSKTNLQLISRNQILSIFVDSQEVGEELRSLAIGQLASSLAAISIVRDWLLPIQRDFGSKGGIVVEGRDMGTRVFPYADAKFFLDADLDIRTSRRHQEIVKEKKSQNWTEVRQNIADRDARDRSRTVAPLVPASDAMVIDTSTLSVDEVVDRMLKVIATRL